MTRSAHNRKTTRRCVGFLHPQDFWGWKSLSVPLEFIKILKKRQGKMLMRWAIKPNSPPAASPRRHRINHNNK